MPQKEPSEIPASEGDSCLRRNLLILITTTYFIGTLELYRQVTSCTCNKTLKKFSLVTMDCSKPGRETKIQYRVASSSICPKTAQNFCVHPTLHSSGRFSNQRFRFLFGTEGLKVNQNSNTVRGRALSFCCVGQKNVITVWVVLPANSICTALPRAHVRQMTTNIFTTTWEYSENWWNVSDDEKQCNVIVNRITNVVLLPWAALTLLGDIFTLLM